MAYVTLSNYPKVRKDIFLQSFYSLSDFFFPTQTFSPQRVIVTACFAAFEVYPVQSSVLKKKIVIITNLFSTSELIFYNRHPVFSVIFSFAPNSKH